MRKSLHFALLSLVVLFAVGFNAKPIRAQLITTPLSTDNPVSTFEVTTGGYKQALSEEGRWKSLYTHKDFHWKTTSTDSYFQHNSWAFGAKGYTFESLLISPPIDMAKAAGTTLTFLVGVGNVRGKCSMPIMLIDENGTKLADLKTISAVAGQQINNAETISIVLPATEKPVVFIAFKVKGDGLNRAHFRVTNPSLAPTAAGAVISFDPSAGLSWDAINAGEVSVGKKLKVFVRNAEGNVSASIEGGNANDFSIAEGGAPLSKEGGELTLFFTPKTGGNKEALLTVTDGKIKASVALRGKAEGNTGPVPEISESIELLNDPFMYEFEGNNPKQYQIGGTPEKLEDGRRYNSSTGFGVSLTTAAEGGYIRQLVDLSREGKTVKAGNELEATIHYCTDESPKYPGPFNLRCRWLDAAGKEISNNEEKELLNNPFLWFGRVKTYGVLKFRTVCPPNAKQFELYVAVDPNSTVRFDDFSLMLLAKKDQTPFVAILPQYITLHGKVGEEERIEVALQTKHLHKEQEIHFGGAEGDLKISGLTAMPKEATKRAALLFKPSKKGFFPIGKPGNYNVTLVGGDAPAILQALTYVIDPANPPTIKVEGGGAIALSTAPSSNIDQMIKIKATGLIESINVKVEQEEAGIFKINTAQLYYSAAQDKLLAEQFKLTFSPKEAKSYSATIVLSTVLGEPVRINVTGKGVAATDGWVENFTAEREKDPRFTGEAWAPYHLFDKGYWYLDGKWLAKGKVEVKEKGLLALDEWFFSGVETVSLATESGAKAFSLEYSVDGGGSFTELAPNDANRWNINNHRPTMIRFRSMSTVPSIVNRIDIVAAKPEERTTFKNVEEAMLLSSTTEPLSLLNENFNGLRHTRTFALKGWQNLSLLAEKPFRAWQQKDAAQTKVEEECVQINMSTFGKTDKREHETWLLSPKLSLKNAASKILTFRLRYALPTPNGKEKFGFYIITLKDNKPTAQYVDITKLLLVKEVLPEQWYDYHIDLAQVEGLAIEDLFHVAFSFYSPVGGGETSLSFMIDDITFGRDDLPTLSVDKEFLTIKFKPGIESAPQVIKVTAKKATSPITVTLNVPGKESNFKITPPSLPSAGGEVSISYKNDSDKDRAAYLLIQTRGAAAKVVRILATTPTEMVEGAEKLLVYPSVTAGKLFVNGEYLAYDLCTPDGRKVAHGKASTELDLSNQVAGSYLLTLWISDKTARSFVVEKR